MRNGVVAGLTRRGRRTLKEPNGVEPDLVLYLEVLNRIGGHGDDENIDGLVDELIRQFGTAEDALVALKCGKVSLEKVDKDEAKAREVRAAIRDLAAKGLLYDTGERRDGQIVWKLTPAGRDMAASELESVLGAPGCHPKPNDTK